MTPSDAMQWLNNGLAVVIVLALGAAAWVTTRWFGTNIVIPMKDSAIAHLQETNVALKSLTETNTRSMNTMAAMHEDVKELKATVGVGCAYRIESAYQVDRNGKVVRQLEPKDNAR